MARWAVITYGKGVDRAAEARELVRRLEGQGLTVAGFFQEKHPDGQGGARFTLVRICRSERLALGATGSRALKPDPESTCSFAFTAGSFARARAWLEEDAPSAQVLVLSEVSKLEAGGQGHHPALSFALALPEEKLVVFLARADQLSYLVEKLAPPGEPVAYLELPSTGAQKQAFLASLAAAGGAR